MTLALENAYPTADSLVKKLRQKSGRRVVDLAEYLRSEAVAVEMQESLPDLKDLDPSHRPYALMMNQVGAMVELMLGVKELAPLVDCLAKAQDEYMPGYPPMSPLTTSFFNAWAFFDQHHGAARETLGTTCLTVGRAFGMHPERTRVLESLCRSHMGFFVNEGRQGDRVILRDMVTGRTSAAKIPAGCYGSKGQLWYVRVMPAARPGLDEVAITTPYIVLAPGLKEWGNYFQRHGGAANYAQHMKEGMAWNYWTEFVFEGYVNHIPEAIYLMGLPDVAETRPHSPSFDEATIRPSKAAGKK